VRCALWNHRCTSLTKVRRADLASEWFKSARPAGQSTLGSTANRTNPRCMRSHCCSSLISTRWANSTHIWLKCTRCSKAVSALGSTANRTRPRCIRSGSFPSLISPRQTRHADGSNVRSFVEGAVAFQAHLDTRWAGWQPHSQPARLLASALSPKASRPGCRSSNQTGAPACPGGSPFSRSAAGHPRGSLP